jgi:hypothetical protein
MLGLLFDLTVGKYAVALSAALGILGSLSLALPPIFSLRLRRVSLQLERLGKAISADATEAAKQRLTREMRAELAREVIWNLAGALLLVLAFAFLFANSFYCGSAPPGTCAG